MSRAPRRKEMPHCAEPLEPRMLLSTSLVSDINSTTSDSNPFAIADLNGIALFAATDGAPGQELWASDGTASGTRLVKNLGAVQSSPFAITAASGLAYFATSDVNGLLQVWKSDGTTAGTVLVAQLTGRVALSPFNGFASASGKVFFATGTSTSLQLWVTDGTQAGTAPIATLACRYDPTVEHPYASPIPGGTVLDDNLYFVGLDSANQPALYRTDGTQAGTVEIAPMPGFVGTEPFASHVGSRVILIGENAVWSSDGTPSGTQQIATSGIRKDDDAAATSTAVVYSSAGRLWATDGTVSGTRDITAGDDAASNSFVGNGNDIYFQTSDGLPSLTWSIWKTDGTIGGTVKLGTFVEIGTVAAAGASVYFGALGSANESQLWKTDGTPAGTVLVRKIWDFSPGMPEQLASVGNELFFSAGDGTYGRELWKSDGTTAGTQLVDDINGNIAASSSNPANLTDVGGQLFFTADDGVHRPQLWKTDGTNAGTQLVKYVMPQTPYYFGFVSEPTDVNGELYYDQASFLWKSDGTDAGTGPVVPLTDTKYSTMPVDLTNLNGTLYFLTTGFTGTPQVWKTDGTAAGTVLQANLPVAANPIYDQFYWLNGKVLLDASGQLYDIENGSATLLGPGAAPSDDESVSQAALLGGNLYYVASVPVGHNALYRTDGTAAGTVMVADLGEPTLPSTIGVVAAGQKLYFIVQEQKYVPNRPFSAEELWVSDGTAAGTQVLREFDEDSLGYGGIGGLTVLGETAYFLQSTSSRAISKSCGRPRQVKRRSVLRRRTRCRRSGLAASRCR